MKKMSIALLVGLSALSGFAEMTGDEILAQVRASLPADSIVLTGSLRMKAANGRTKGRIPVEMKLDWGAEPAHATYQIGPQKLQIRWDGSAPTYLLSEAGVPQANFNPNDEIQGSGVYWADLSFAVLWWPNSKFIKEEKKLDRHCYVVEVPVPNSTDYMRLWIEKEMGMLLEAQTFSADNSVKYTRRVKIESIKKIDGMWVASDMRIDTRATGEKTLLELKDLKRVKRELPEPVAEVEAYDPVENNNRFALELYRQLASARTNNMFFSPFSISTALAMTYGGARGETATQMEKTFHFSGQNLTHPAFGSLADNIRAIQGKGAVEITTANSLWPQVDFKLLPEFLTLTSSFYDSENTAVDYKTDAEGARTTINNWVADKTNDKITDLIPEGVLDSMTRLVLANAIYFKGNWKHQFKPTATRPAPFKCADGTSVDVPTMSLKESFKLGVTNDVQVLELPYEGDDLSMLILLPAEADGLPSLEEEISPEWLGQLKLHQQEVMVRLPKFKLEDSFGLGDTLAAMGMPLAFSDQADFSGMTGARDLFISAVVHKAFVEVNEEGTEAAAATGVVIGLTSMPMQFSATHPFLFLIRENQTGSILFIGRVMEPSQ